VSERERERKRREWVEKRTDVIFFFDNIITVIKLINILIKSLIYK